MPRQQRLFTEPDSPASTSAPAAAPAPPPSAADTGRPRLFLVDGPNIAFRAHHAMPTLTSSLGEPTGALFGYCSMLFKLLKDHRPDYLVLAWDPKGGSFRNEIYADYKGHRPDMPDELRRQLPLFPEIAAALGIAHLVVPGFEADDVIGTLTARYKESCDVTIVTGDKDMMQLIEKGRVTVLDTMREQRFGPEEVRQRWGVPPERIVDMLALMGDASDNIPGVRGIGEKGAAELINAFGSIAGIFAHAEAVKGRNRKPLLAEGARQAAELSYRLATIRCDVAAALELGLEQLRYEFPPRDRQAVAALFQRLEFHRFLSELGGTMVRLDRDKYRCVTTAAELDALLCALRAAPVISVDTETTAIDPTRADLVGMSFCVNAEEAWYVPLRHTTGAGEQLPIEMVLAGVAPLLHDPAKTLIGQHIKYDQIVLAAAGVQLGRIGGDTLIADFLLKPDRRTHNLDDLALTWIGHRMITYEEVTKDTGGQFAAVPLADATRYAAEDAHAVFLIHDKMVAALREAALDGLYAELEVPLIPVLGRMEAHGVLIDCDYLRAYGAELEEQIRTAEALTWEKAGKKFNSASPKQLAEILFTELKLPVIKKTKTGPSTDASVLEELAARHEHELPEAILRFRGLSKLKSTYVDALPPLVNPRTGRIHTSYHQTVAATGRLSSADPNLQNIPVRTPEGRRVRQAFIAPPGTVLLSADYSQIELRVLAHLCGGRGGFAAAFAADQDVHRRTAAEIFDVAPEAVTAEQRRAAKAINFGLVYGQGEFGLSQVLKISRKEAAEYIRAFKERYPEIDAFMAETVAFAEAHGYVRTLRGRKRPIGDIASSNHNLREAARRAAINTPVQGSAADIIKMAMLTIDEHLRASFPGTQMIMQVHDELVFEVPVADLERLRDMVVTAMESVCELSVPLRVDTGAGANWDEAH